LEIFIIQFLNSVFYASILFLIAAGLSLIYGVMQIINLAHGSLYALGAYVTAWAVGTLAAGGHVVLLFLLLPAGAVAVAAVGMVIEPTLLRPLYKRPEEYQLLVTFALLLILEDVMRFLFGGVPLSADAIMDATGSIPVMTLKYPVYNLMVIGIGILAALFLWAFIYRTRFGIMLRATSQDRRMASALGINVKRVYMQAFAIGCFMAGLLDPPDGHVRESVMKFGFIPTDKLSPWRLAAHGAPIVVVLLLFPQFGGLYQTQLLTYGLIFAIAALGFNLLLGYTGLLSFGHSAYFALGAYTAAFMVKYLGVGSMELYILGGLLITAVISAAFGYVCVRHTRIFFAVLTLALSQVYQSFVFSYYYYVVGLFLVCVSLMWVIVHSPFGKALQAIRDNETRAQFLGIRVRHYRWIAFLVSGTFTGLAGILWVPLNGLVTPDIAWWPFSGEIVFMTVLGGFRNFTGPIIGAVVFNYLKTYAIASTVFWQAALGIILLVLVLALPAGIVGACSRLTAKLRQKKEDEEDMAT
jgi:ABC-type branched-subunit amino acid transport system permease subunit